MRFNTTREMLLKGIQSVQNAINTKSTLPILSNILIETKGNSTVFTATDLDMGIVVETPIKPSVEGAITVPAKKFMDIVKELPDKEEISVSVKKNNMVHIECGANTFKIMGLLKDEYPQLPEFKNKEQIVLQQKKLKQMLKMTSFAISNDEARYVLNGVLVAIKPNCIRLAATDGRRLAVVEDKMQLPKTLERKLIVPTKTIDELMRILGDDGDVKIFLGENQVLFDLGATKVVSRLIEGEFPNYEQVIPKEAKEKVGIGNEAFLSALRRVALFTNPDSMGVKMDLDNNKMVLSKSMPYLGEARVEMAVDYKGKAFPIGFNPNYLIDALKNIEEESVNLELTDSEKPGVIRIGSDYIYVVLPMQL